MRLRVEKNKRKKTGSSTHSGGQDCMAWILYLSQSSCCSTPATCSIAICVCVCVCVCVCGHSSCACVSIVCCVYMTVMDVHAYFFFISKVWRQAVFRNSCQPNSIHSPCRERVTVWNHSLLLAIIFSILDSWPDTNFGMIQLAICCHSLNLLTHWPCHMVCLFLNTTFNHCIYLCIQPSTRQYSDTLFKCILCTFYASCI